MEHKAVRFQLYVYYVITLALPCVGVAPTAHRLCACYCYINKAYGSYTVQQNAGEKWTNTNHEQNIERQYRIEYNIPNYKNYNEKELAIN